MDARSPDLSDTAAVLLAWYDAHARVLPWRSPPGVRADPYRVWLSEVMLQQTTVAAVRPRFVAWVARWPSVEALAAAEEAEVMAAWAGLGYYARARNLVRTAREVAARGGFPTSEAGLRALPGLGAYTAASVAAIAFGVRAVVVDANVERVVARLFAIDAPLLGARASIRAAANVITPDERAGDFAQGMMDLGATICTPRAPRCMLCPLRPGCAAFALGEPERLPVKAAKRARPQRYGTIFWVEKQAAVRAEPVEAPHLSSTGAKKGGPSTSSGRTEERLVLLVTRPATGLLGGMRALPTGPWVDAPPGLTDAPVEAGWRVLEASVAHGFTHFDLQLALAVAKAPAHLDGEGEWWPVAELVRAGLPTLFAKAAEAIGREICD
ncbi:MAG TPA: A/G-specific adenine glycosylase [Sphingomonas sp.]